MGRWSCCPPCSVSFFPPHSPLPLAPALHGLTPFLPLSLHYGLTPLDFPTSPPHCDLLPGATSHFHFWITFIVKSTPATREASTATWMALQASDSMSLVSSPGQFSYLQQDTPSQSHHLSCSCLVIPDAFCHVSSAWKVLFLPWGLANVQPSFHLSGNMLFGKFLLGHPCSLFTPSRSHFLHHTCHGFA